jgi:transposase-like protein
LTNLDLIVTDWRLVELVRRHGEDGHRLYLEELRWPGGPECPRCESGDLLWLERRRRYHYRRCRYQFRVVAGTVFHDSHLPLWKWFLAVGLMLSDEGVSALRLSQVIGGSYKTAWFREHRIRAAMTPAGEEVSAPLAYVAATGAAAAASSRAVGGRLDAAPPGWPLLRSVIAGSHVSPGFKYLSAYWGEARWRDAHRENPTAFRDTVLALLQHPWLSFGELTGTGAVKPLFMR